MEEIIEEIQETQEIVEVPKKKRTKKVVEEPTPVPVVEEPAVVPTPEPKVEAPKAVKSKEPKCKCDGRAIRVLNRFGRHQVCSVCGLKK